MKFRSIVEGMHVYPERMIENLDASYGLVFSQPVLLALVEAGQSRDDAYRVVQRNALRTWEERRPFIDVLREDPEITKTLSDEQLAGVLRPEAGDRERRPHLRGARRARSDRSLTEPMTITLPHLYTGKVRDLYDAGDDRLLMVASDRVSVFDVVLPDLIPDKGRVLTAISSFWFDQVADLLPNHVISVDPADFPAGGPARRRRPGDARAPHRAGADGVHRPRLPVRRRLGRVPGARDGAGPADAGRDAGGRAAARAAVHPDDQGRERPRPADVRRRGDRRGRRGRVRAGCATPRSRSTSGARRTPRARGIILADTKFEFGLAPDGELLLIDEVLTPDSSRYWPAEDYAVGGSPPSFDKQYVRDYYLTLDWDRTPPAPPLPADVIAGTRAALRRGVRTAHRPVLRRLVRRIVSDG